ncbi:uncharacterized protein LOC9640360 [Selaginella moellendorffii]|uniref:uncharacterized protein LOC9640360 n=1 Tax=Selaginella moellendorffii TaxID=88036 RepID=UPI000D1CCA7B|nr:uncharacterized protein LOC9640360 [Selaginella moellendorffii]|eukprot:XP_024515581.1 uncharacterized protein LOC9640360 [Selaginella moellendorffii]
MVVYRATGSSIVCTQPRKVAAFALVLPKDAAEKTNSIGLLGYRARQDLAKMVYTKADIEWQVIGKYAACTCAASSWKALSRGSATGIRGGTTWYGKDGLCDKYRRDVFDDARNQVRGGLSKQAIFDPQTGMTTLELTPISQSRDSKSWSCRAHSFWCLLQIVQR